MPTYKELLAQKEQLELALAQQRQEEVDGVVERIKEAIDVYGLTPLELFARKDLVAAMAGKGAKGAAAGAGGLPAKFRNPETNQTWSGRGRMPSWMTPETADDFLIQT